jgi:hypothetical protein
MHNPDRTLCPARVVTFYGKTKKRLRARLIAWRARVAELLASGALAEAPPGYNTRPPPPREPRAAAGGGGGGGEASDTDASDPDGIGGTFVGC